MRPAALSILAAFLLALALPCAAQEPSAGGGTVISADVLEKRGRIILGRGSVAIESDGTTVRAGSLRYDTATGEVVAEDGVSFEDERASITASKAHINLRAETGVLEEAEILFKEEGYRVSGDRIEKAGPGLYRLDRGSLTTCPGPLPDWCVRARDVELVVGDRIKSKDATFRVRGVPVLYTPYFRASLGAKRKTGFLFPTVGYGDRKGLNLRQPFFWALAENRDATFLLDAYARRGVGLGAEYRYIESPDVRGRASFYHIRDTELHRSFDEVRAEHTHRWRGLRGFYDINYVSEKDFYREYEPHKADSSRRFLESQAEASVRAGRLKLFADARYLRELDEDRDQKAVAQKLPEGGLFLAPLGLGPAVVTAEFTASNFERGTGPDGRRLDGTLALGNSIGRGPTFSQELALGLTRYDLNGMSPGAEGSFSRGSLAYSAALRTSLGRQFGEVEHIVTPSLFYAYRDLEEDEEAPLLDFRELATDVSEAGLELFNRLRDSRGEFLTLRVRQAYGFLPEDDDLKPLELDLSFHRVLSLALSLHYDWNARRVEKSASEASFTVGRVRIGGGHTYERDGATMYRANAAFEATRSLTLTTAAWYDPRGGDLERLSLGAAYRTSCWALAVDFTRRPEENVLFVTLTLRGLGDIEL
jgi:LPS-assembly protein